MSDNLEMVTNAKQLHERFMIRAKIYMCVMKITRAKLSCAKTHSQSLKYVHESNRQSLFIVITCYGDATNMTFEQAKTALGVSDTMLERLS